MPDVSLILKALKCRRCGREVARTNGADLFVSGKAMAPELRPRRIQFDCCHCGYPVKWNKTDERHHGTETGEL